MYLIVDLNVIITKLSGSIQKILLHDQKILQALSKQQLESLLHVMEGNANQETTMRIYSTIKALRNGHAQISNVGNYEYNKLQGIHNVHYK